MSESVLATVLHQDLLPLIDARQHLVAVVKQAQEELDRFNSEIKTALVATGVDTCQIGDYTVTLSVRERSTLDKGKLVDLGVSTETIAKATKTSGYTQLDVREKKA